MHKFVFSTMNKYKSTCTVDTSFKKIIINMLWLTSNQTTFFRRYFRSLFCHVLFFMLSNKLAQDMFLLRNLFNLTVSDNLYPYFRKNIWNLYQQQINNNIRVQILLLQILWHVQKYVWHILLWKRNATLCRR